MLSELHGRLHRQISTPTRLGCFLSCLFVIAANGSHSLSDDRSQAAKALVVQPATTVSDANAVTSQLDELRRLYRDQHLRMGKVFRYESSNVANSAATVSIGFSPDGRFLCVGENNEQLVGSRGIAITSTGRSDPAKDYAMPRLRDLKTGLEVRRFGGHTGTYIQSVSMSGDSRLMASTCFTGYHQRSFVMLDSQGNAVPDGEDVRVWNVATGEQLMRLPNAGVQATLSRDGEWLVVVGTGHVTGYRLRDALVQTNPKAAWRLIGDADIGVEAAISPDDSQVAIVIDTTRKQGTPRSVTLLDIVTGKVRRQFPTDADTLSWSFDGAFLAVGNERHAVVWDVAHGSEVRRLELKQRVSLVAFDSAAQHAITIDEHGDCCKWSRQTGEKLLEISLGHDSTYAISPDRRTIAVGQRRKGTIDLVDLDSGARLVRFHQFHKERTWLTETLDGAYDANREFVRLNQLLWEDLGLRHDPRRISQILAALGDRPPPGNPVRSRPTGIKSRLFVLAVGVSQYKYPEYTLHYAAADAKELERYFREPPVPVFDDVVTKVYTDDDATVDNLKKGLQWLNTSCTERDMAVILFSGHGDTARNGLYFIPHEGDAEGLQYTCLNWTHVSEAVGNTKAKAILFLADCCHAGAFATDRRASQDDFARAFANKKGMLLMCSSTKDQRSWELASLGHGAFTYAVLQGLRGGADADRNGTITFGELQTFVDRDVRQITNGKQTPYVPFPDNFDPQTIISRNK